jgi:hypothetical protein
MNTVRSNLLQPIILRSLLTFHDRPGCLDSACAQDTAWWWRLPGHGGPGPILPVAWITFPRGARLQWFPPQLARSSIFNSEGRPALGLFNLLRTIHPCTPPTFQCQSVIPRDHFGFNTPHSDRLTRLPHQAHNLQPPPSNLHLPAPPRHLHPTCCRFALGHFECAV